MIHTTVPSNAFVGRAFAARIVGVSAFGRRVAIVDDSAIVLDMQEQWQYVRFECWGDGEQFAWTQPFFVR